MRKILLLLVSFTFVNIINAQDRTCIMGPDTMYVGDVANFSITSFAQCSQCYNWDWDSNLSISGSDILNNATFTALTLGKTELCVTIFNGIGNQRCCKTIYIIPGPCCEPELDSYYICANQPHGSVFIDFTGCNSSTVSSIDWMLNNAEFSSGPLDGQSSGTTYGPGSPGNIEGSCVDIDIQATVHYNNGCPDQVLTETIIPSTLISDLSIDVYPNPTSNHVIVDLRALSNHKNLKIVFLDMNSGKELFSKSITNASAIKKINVANFGKDKVIQIIVFSDSQPIYNERIVLL